MMRDRIRNAAAITIVVLCLGLSIPPLLAPPVEFTGITLRLEGSSLVVASVDPGTTFIDLFQPGTVISEVNFTPVASIAPKWMDAYLRGDFIELGVAAPEGGTTQVTFPPSPARP